VVSNGKLNVGKQIIEKAPELASAIGRAIIVFARLDYCKALLAGGATSQSIERLQRLQNQFTRTVVGVGRAHAELILNRLN